MSSLKEVVNKEKILRCRLNKFIDNTRGVESSKRTQGFYVAKISDLKKIWEDYSAIDLTLNETLCEEEAEESNAYLEEDNYRKTELRYSELMSELMEELRSFSANIDIQSTSSGPPHASTVIQQETALPRISLPTFYGDYDRWRSFHDMFISLVHDNPRLSAVQKLHHLKACLVGDAERVLRHTPVTNQDYEPAWNKLKERYENKRILVNYQLKALVNQPKQQLETSKGLKSIIDTTEECLQQLKSLQVNTSSWDVLLVYLLVQKLPFTTLKLWEEDQGVTQDLPRLSIFIAFLNKRLKISESLTDVLVTKAPQLRPTFKQTTLTCYTTKDNQCPVCKGDHRVQKCSKYQAMNTEARLKVIKASGSCLNCLSNNHQLTKCSSKHKCFRCNKKHHTSLHIESEREKQFGTPQQIKNKTYENTRQASTSQKQSRQNEGTDRNNSPIRGKLANSIAESNVTQTFINRESHHALLSTALVMVKSDYGEPIVLRCLIDSGSQASFITEDACKKLGASCTPTSVEITGLNTSLSAEATQQTKLQLTSCGCIRNTLEENFLVLKNITNSLPTKVVSRNDWRHLAGLKLADPTFWKPGRIDALLGARVYAKAIREGIRRGPDTAPVAVNTMFGWILLGATNKTFDDKVETRTFTTTVDLTEQIKRFWEVEELPIQSVLNKREEECQKIYQTSYTRLSNGTYQVKLPFINNQVPTLGHSRSQAIKRFSSLQRKFLNNPELEQDYTKCLNEYIELGHMEEISPPIDNQPHYYIPHHAVFKKSTTTKLRVVFDASAKTTNGRSLNDYLLKGPTLQPKLFATLLNWRRHRIAMIADIEKMYRMIEMHPDHRTFQRIIWQNPATKQIQDYQLKTVTFGTSAAPYLAVRTLQQLAKDEGTHWPLASRATYTDFYVDDLLTGAENIADAKKIQVEFINMMKAGGFNLRKWASNEPKLLEDVPVDYREVKSELLLTEDESIKTLGIKWHPVQDHFTFTITQGENHLILTKRIILSEIASLYDPLGWLAPIIIVAKILMQTLWITGCSWDTPVTEAIQLQWEKFKIDLQQVQQLRIPRWIHYSKGTNMELHGFCDASERAYAAVLYLRVEDTNGNITSTLLTYKTKEAPIKPTTIPRLELNGAVILARLIKTTIEDMKLNNIPVFAWTDSTIVLQWINDHPSRWKSYVANRVVEIQDILKHDRWQHVSTVHNPADLASRGSSATNLRSNDLWWHGPSWLVSHSSDWPRSKIDNSHTELEAKRAVTSSFIINAGEDILLRYSSFTRLVRIVATIKRFINNCRDPNTKRVEFLNNAECSQATTTILKIVQQIAFQEEYKQLVHNKQLPKNSRLLKLNPFMDRTGLIRLGGRLDNATIPYARKHPIILPQQHHVTSIIIDKFHRETLHGGPSLVLNMSRNQYWILNARRSITSRLHQCVTCAKHRKSVSTQLMGNLPSSRVNITKPFTKVGIDYAGPITIKTSTLRNAKRQKAYFCIFVCMATRAIHIELVSDLTAEAFLAALKRFVARRGLCTDIFSGCGTNFVGAKTMLEKDLRQAIKEAEPKAAQYLASQAINWHFNPPASPHFGGIWEAGVKSIKYHLRRTLGNASCTFEEYATILAQIEACLNSRPLCQVHNDPEELFVLTPGHFLIGQPLNAIAEPDYSNCKQPLTQRWKYYQQLVKQFWDKWSKVYLNQLQHRPKWQTTQANIKTGDVVVIKNENMPPTSWPLGIIECVYPGKDGLVRVVQIRTQNSSLQRPIAKMSKFESTDEDVLCILEDIRFSPPRSPMADLFLEPGCDVLTGLPKKSLPNVSTTSSAGGAHPTEQQKSRQPSSATYLTTPHTKVTTSQPVYINGRQLESLHHLKPTTNIDELRMRAGNTHQRFTTREGIDIYLQQHILARIDFDTIRNAKRKTKTINLPDRYQAFLHVTADGQILFQRYHKRGISKIRARLNASVQRGGECSATKNLKGKKEKELAKIRPNLKYLS